jgi:hypothetical protein
VALCDGNEELRELVGCDKWLGLSILGMICLTTLQKLYILLHRHGNNPINPTHLTIPFFLNHLSQQFPNTNRFISFCMLFSRLILSLVLHFPIIQAHFPARTPKPHPPILLAVGKNGMVFKDLQRKQRKLVEVDVRMVWQFREG